MSRATRTKGSRTPQPESATRAGRTVEDLFDALRFALEQRAGEPVSVTLAAVTAEQRFFYLSNVEKRASVSVMRALADHLSKR